jgi:hypothetical protein
MLITDQPFHIRMHRQPFYEKVRIAQLAVCLGASDPSLSELKAYPDGLLSV